MMVNARSAAASALQDGLRSLVDCLAADADADRISRSVADAAGLRRNEIHYQFFTPATGYFYIQITPTTDAARTVLGERITGSICASSTIVTYH